MLVSGNRKRSLAGLPPPKPSALFSLRRLNKYQFFLLKWWPVGGVRARRWREAEKGSRRAGSSERQAGGRGRTETSEKKLEPPPTGHRLALTRSAQLDRLYGELLTGSGGPVRADGKHQLFISHSNINQPGAASSAPYGFWHQSVELRKRLLGKKKMNKQKKPTKESV